MRERKNNSISIYFDWVIYKFMDIMQLIDAIQKRPKAYIKEEKIEYIFYLLFGYCGACHKFSEDELNKMFCCWFGKWLIEWINDNVIKGYIPKGVFWYEDIKFIAQNEQEEISVFFTLCKNFFDDYSNKQGYFLWRD